MPNERRRPGLTTLGLAAALGAAGAGAAGVASAQPPSVPPSSTQPTSAPDSTPRAFDFTAAYTAQLVRNAAGGARGGTVGVGTGAVQLTTRLERLVGWRGARAFVYVLGTHGGRPSALVGDLQGVSNLEAPPAIRLEEAWLEQNLSRDRLSVLAGRFDLNAEFYRLQSTGLFVNSALGVGPEFAQSGATGPSIYPRTTPGGRVLFKPSAATVVRLAAVSQGSAGGVAGGASGTPASGGGALVLGEAALLARPDTGALPRERRLRVGRSRTGNYTGKLAVGAWYYTGRFADLSDTVAAGPLAGTPVRHRGSRGAYVIGDQTVWSAPNGGPGALTVFAQLGVGDARVGPIGRYLSGGVTSTAPTAARPKDEVGVAATAAFVGSHARRAAPAGARGGSETTLEVTYSLQLTPWLALQPDVQYVIRPGGLGAVRNAWVPVLRVSAAR